MFWLLISSEKELVVTTRFFDHIMLWSSTRPNSLWPAFLDFFPRRNFCYSLLKFNFFSCSLMFYSNLFSFSVAQIINSNLWSQEISCMYIVKCKTEENRAPNSHRKQNNNTCTRDEWNTRLINAITGWPCKLLFLSQTGSLNPVFIKIQLNYLLSIDSLMSSIYHLRIAPIRSQHGYITLVDMKPAIPEGEILYGTQYRPFLLCLYRY